MIRSKTGMSLEITLNVFIVSLVPLKFLHWQQHQFLFILVGTLSVCQFAMVRGVYPCEEEVTVPQEEEVHSSS